MAAEVKCRKCSLCGMPGHTKRTCSEKVTLTESPTVTAPQELETCEFEHDDACAEIIQKQDLLYKATQKLDSVIVTVDGCGCFDSEEDKEEKLERIRRNPEAILSSSEKPFMKKIASAMMDVEALTKEVVEAKKKMRDRQSDAQVHEALANVIKLKSKVTKLKAKINAMEGRMIEQQKDHESLMEQQRVRMDSKFAEHAKKVEETKQQLAEHAKQAEEMKQQFAELMKRLEDKPKGGLLSFGKGGAK